MHGQIDTPSVTAAAPQARGVIEVSLLRDQQQREVGRHIIDARNPLRRLVGLLGRRDLTEGEGCWLEPCSSVHTLGMRFALDLLCVDRGGKVVRVVEALAPWRAARGPHGTRAILELPAGTASKLGIVIGDQLIAHR